MNEKLLKLSMLIPSDIRLIFSLIFFIIILNSIFAQSTRDTLKHDHKKLAEQVNNPTSPLAQFQLRDVLSGRVPGYDGNANLFQLVPTLPVPSSEIFNFDQIIKITFQLPTSPNPGSETGFGDITLFDLFSIEESWGRWGAGLTFVFPTASSEILGQGKWQTGPAAAVMFTGIQNLIMGAVFQNQISFAGNSSREDVNTLFITPTITWNFPDGWFAGYSDFDWTFNWRNDGEATIPLGLQGGKVISLGSTPVSLSIEACWVAVHPDNFPEWLLGFECVLIFPSFIK